MQSLRPEPAIQAVLKAFSRYEVVGIDAGHENKDVDDFLLALIRDPAFPSRVNDLPGPQSVPEFNRQLIASAGDVVLTTEKLPDAQQFYPMIRNLCLEAKKNAK